MTQRGERDHGKERFWRRMLRQWRSSGQGVRDFCTQHRLSEPSFYAWRRIIAARDQQAAARPRPDANRYGHRRVARSEQGAQGGSDTSGAPRGSGTPNSSPPLFLPVRLAPTALATLDVVLRDGRSVRVPVGFDAATLRQLLAVLAEAPPC